MKTRYKLAIIGAAFFTSWFFVPYFLLFDILIYEPFLDTSPMTKRITHAPESLKESYTIDPRIVEVTNGFAITSDMQIYSVMINDDQHAIVIETSSDIQGFISMDDPLPVLQKLFPQREITSIAVLADGIEMPYSQHDNKLGFMTKGAQEIKIIGFSKI